MKEHERKVGDNEKKDEKFSEKIAGLNARISILESRSQRFEIKAAEQFKDLQKALLNDSRLATLKNKG